MTERILYTISDFCRVAGISRSHFYKLLREGVAPRTVKLGRRRLIPVDGLGEWVRQ